MWWFHQEETKLKSVVGIKEEEQNLAHINKMRKGSKKGGRNKGHKGKKEDLGSSNQGEKDLSHIKCFKGKKFGHYASQWY